MFPPPSTALLLLILLIIGIISTTPVQAAPGIIETQPAGVHVPDQIPPSTDDTSTLWDVLYGDGPKPGAPGALGHYPRPRPGGKNITKGRWAWLGGG